MFPFYSIANLKCTLRISQYTCRGTFISSWNPCTRRISFKRKF